MKKVVLVVVFSVIFSTAIFAKNYNLLTIKDVKVNWIVDGDTINVIPKKSSVKKFGIKLKKTYGKMVMKIRMLGLECSELKKCKKRKGRRLSNHECKEEKKKGKKALHKLIKILKNKTVNLVCLSKNGKVKTDYFKRSLCYVEYEGKDIGAEMSKTDWCWDYNFKYPHPREKSYKDK